MPFIRAVCSGCGAPLEIQVAGMFAETAVVHSMCPICNERQVSAAGGVVLALERELPGARFALGEVTVTAGAIEALAESNQHAVDFLRRHVQGDWGASGQLELIVLTEDERRRGWEATDDSGKINASNLLQRQGDIMSEYSAATGRPLWIVTSLNGRGGTTIFLPEEY